MTGYESKKAMAQDKITDEQGRPITYWGGKAQPAQDLSEQGRNRSAVLGNNVEAMMDAGLPFLKALETTLKVYDHDVPKLGCVNHDCDKCKAQPAQRPLVELTDTEIDAEANSILTSDPVQWWRRFARAVLAKSREKNNGT